MNGFLPKGGAWRSLLPLILVAAVTVGVFLAETQDVAPVRILGQNQHWIRSLVFSPNGKMLAAGGGVVGDKQELVLWDVVTGQRRTVLLGDGPSVEALAFSPDGKWLGLVERWLSVRVLDAASGEKQASFPTPSYWQECLCFSADSRQLFVLGSDDRLGVWDVTERTLRWLPGPAPGVFCASRSGILFTAPGSEIGVWDITTGKERGRFPIPPSTTWSAAAMVSSGQDHAVKLWDVHTGEEVATLGRHDAAVFAVDIAPDGRHVASGGFDKTVRLWDIEGLRTTTQPQPNRASGACLSVKRWFGMLVSSQVETLPCAGMTAAPGRDVNGLIHDGSFAGSGGTDTPSER
jgi:WD40 repeat protein